MAEQNIALNRPTSASSFVKPYESARAVSGTYGSTTPTSRWLCNTLPGWLMVDLGVNGSNPYWINRWVVRHMSVAGWRTPDYNMCDFKLQGSNDRNAWYDMDGVVGNTVGITDRSFTAVAYRYVRLYVTKGLKCNTKMASAMELEVYQSPPLSAYLQSGTGLTVSSGALSPAFVNNVFNYTTPNVANSVTSVAVKPTAEDSRATIKVNNVVVTSGSSTNVTLNVGSNDIKVVVTAADGRTTNTYTVTVVRDAAPVIAELSALSITPGTLNETFAPSTLAYTASVGYDVSSITVTPTTTISGATITVNGVTVASGTASGSIPLNVGNGNAINVVVTNGTATKTYTITVTRAAALTGLSANIVGGAAISLTPSPFDGTKLSYAGTIEYSNANFGVQDVAIIPTADTGVLIKYNGNTINSGTAVTITPAVGDTTVTFDVSALDGSGLVTYEVKITRKHSTYLKTLSIMNSGGTKISWDNPFIKGRNNYTITTDAPKVKITFTVEDSTSTASMKINNVVAASPVTVPNVVTIEVTSTLGISPTIYTINLVKG